mmetsp:Transcript_11124/g.23394  ORF Transcript_11124/g.23394 Transcript_11124/m.23394 type:complete len:90 (-) Transcript_11124:250-519(-)
MPTTDEFKIQLSPTKLNYPSIRPENSKFLRSIFLSSTATSGSSPSSTCFPNTRSMSSNPKIIITTLYPAISTLAFSSPTQTAALPFKSL